jgi:hypothetical protein
MSQNAGNMGKCASCMKERSVPGRIKSMSGNERGLKIRFM